ncbi:MAG TPA: hypothetical protein VGW36_01350 [Pyrinomonadaceae bacterium]|nr:hypothetical protein [Pyrinomonadaceae bacterium]
MLVNLLKLPARGAAGFQTPKGSVVIRRAEPFEITKVSDFIRTNFSTAWADEVSVGFSNKPVTVYLAVIDGEIAGFAAYECTRKSFFGPTGVASCHQSNGIGKALLLAGLWGLREMGYVYGIIGGVGPVEFYEKAVGATVIPDSGPGIYNNLLK